MSSFEQNKYEDILNKSKFSNNWFTSILLRTISIFFQFLVNDTLPKQLIDLFNFSSHVYGIETFASLIQYTQITSHTSHEKFCTADIF